MRTTRISAILFIMVCVAVVGLAPSAALADHYPPTSSHWSNSYPQRTTKAQVYLHDYTGASWPVINAVGKWDDQSHLLVYYKSAGTCNNNLVHCVTVYEYEDKDLAGGRAYGVTSITIDSSRHLVHGSVSIRFNKYYVPYTTAAQRRKVTCHEIGHALGLAESSMTNSCMDNQPNHWYEYTSWHDFDVLRQLYQGHSDW